MTRLKMNELKPGEMIGGRYKVVRTVDKTAFGCHYEVSLEGASGCKAEAGAKLMAKVISSELHIRDGFERTLIKSAQAWSRIRHPKVATILDAGESKQGAFMVSEMLENRDLGAVLSHKKTLGWKDAKPIFLDACTALSAIHEAGIVHGDIAPDQFLLIEGPDGMGARLLPPDMILTASSEPYGERGWVVGRPQYLSPEQVRMGLLCEGPWNLSGLADIFALGAVLHRTLTGQGAFEGENDCEIVFSRLSRLPKAPSERVPGISSEIDALVMRALRIEPKDRYQSAALFRAAMESVQ